MNEMKFQESAREVSEKQQNSRALLLIPQTSIKVKVLMSSEKSDEESSQNFISRGKQFHHPPLSFIDSFPPSDHKLPRMRQIVALQL
jgi:hypothetical protein